MEELLRLGWVDMGDIMVRYSSPRIGWKPSDGTLIIGWHEYPEKITDVRTMLGILKESAGS